MEGGFRFLLAGIVLIALAFSLVSVWPAFTEPNPRLAPGQNVAQVSTTPPTPRLPNLRPQQPPPLTAKRQSNQQFQPPTNPQGLIANAKPRSIEVAEFSNWVYTKKRVTLLKAPDGDPHRASSINNAKLEIMGGTRLSQVRSEDGWLLVKSPSKLYGWLRETDVSSRSPVISDTEWSLYPSE